VLQRGAEFFQREPTAVIRVGLLEGRFKRAAAFGPRRTFAITGLRRTFAIAVRLRRAFAVTRWARRTFTITVRLRRTFAVTRWARRTFAITGWARRAFACATWFATGLAAVVAQRYHATHELGTGEQVIAIVIETLEQRSRRRTGWTLMLTLRAVSSRQQVGHYEGQ